MIDKKMIKISTPLARVKRIDYPSPSNIDSDQMLLPCMNKKGELSLTFSGLETEPVAVKKKVDNPYMLCQLKTPNLKERKLTKN